MRTSEPELALPPNTWLKALTEFRKVHPYRRKFELGSGKAELGMDPWYMVEEVQTLCGRHTAAHGQCPAGCPVFALGGRCTPEWPGALGSKFTGLLSGRSAGRRNRRTAGHAAAACGHAAHIPDRAGPGVAAAGNGTAGPMARQRRLRATEPIARMYPGQDAREVPLTSVHTWFAAGKPLPEVAVPGSGVSGPHRRRADRINPWTGGRYRVDAVARFQATDPLPCRGTHARSHCPMYEGCGTARSGGRLTPRRD